MQYLKLFFSRKINTYKFGEAFFLIGIFFLCSSLIIGGSFLFISFILGSFIQNKQSSYFKDKWNLPFFLCGLLIIFSALIQNFFLQNNLEEIWDPNLSFIGIANWLPFFWRGFSQSTRYTYRLNDLSNMDNLWNNFSGNVRKEIRKSKNRFNIVIREDKPLSELYALCTKTFERQKKKVSYNFSILENIDRACKERQCSKVFIAEDPKGRQHAGLYMIWDKKNAYYLTGGGDPDYRNSGATSLCFYHAISFASKVTTSFDFEGSMIESIERFFRGFGAIQTPYFAIFHTPSKRYKLLKKFKSGKDFLFENYIKK